MCATTFNIQSNVFMTLIILDVGSSVVACRYTLICVYLNESSFYLKLLCMTVLKRMACEFSAFSNDIRGYNTHTTVFLTTRTLWMHLCEFACGESIWLHIARCRPIARSAFLIDNVHLFCVNPSWLTTKIIKWFSGFYTTPTSGPALLFAKQCESIRIV